MAFRKKPKTINPDEVDPSVYYYDEVYDEMKDEERPKSSRHTDSRTERDRGSKYIQGLKETAEQRKTEKEIRKFKKYARDREEARADGEFSDKDVYITPAYKEKLKEIEKMEEEKLRRLELEKDMSMNFLRKPTINTDNIITSRTSNLTDDNNLNKNELQKDNIPDNETLINTQNLPVRKPKLKTLDERRKYLREILAKRTIGKVYQETLQRYIERKALTQK